MVFNTKDTSGSCVFMELGCLRVKAGLVSPRSHFRPLSRSNQYLCSSGNSGGLYLQPVHAGAWNHRCNLSCCRGYPRLCFDSLSFSGSDRGRRTGVAPDLRKQSDRTLLDCNPDPDCGDVVSCDDSGNLYNRARTPADRCSRCDRDRPPILVGVSISQVGDCDGERIARARKRPCTSIANLSDHVLC